MLKVQTQEGVRNKLLVRTDEQSSFYFLLISSLWPNVSLHCYLYRVFFHTPSMKKKSKDCLLSIALVIGENVCEIKRQKFRIWNMEGEVMTKGTDERGSVLRQCWGESRSTRTNRKQLVDVRQVWDGEMLEVEKKDKELALLFFSFPLCPSFLSLLLVFLVVWASDSCALF